MAPGLSAAPLHSQSRGAALRRGSLSRSLPPAHDSPPPSVYLRPRGGLCGPFPGAPASAHASRGSPLTVDLVRGGIVLVEAFGHVEPSHFRATFRLGFGSQQRGAEHGQGAEKRGQAEPGHGAGRGRRAPTSGTGGEWRERAEECGAGGSRAEREGEGVGVGVGGAAGGGDAGKKVELGLARQATVPGARRPAGGGGGEGGGRGGGARPTGTEARAGGLRAPRGGGRGAPAGSRTGARGRRRWQAPPGPRRAWAAAGARCALLRLPGAGPLSWLSSAHSALGRAAVPSSAPPLIDWSACAATLGKLGPAGGTQGEGAGGGGAGDGREHAGPGREKTWKRARIRSGQIHFLGGRTGRAALPRATRPAGLLPPPFFPSSPPPLLPSSPPLLPREAGDARLPLPKEGGLTSPGYRDQVLGDRAPGHLSRSPRPSHRPSARGHLTR